MRRIKIEIVRFNQKERGKYFDNLITFKITEQSHRGEDFSPYGNFFAASNSVILKSCSSPARDVAAEILFVRGDVREFDETEIIVTVEDFVKISEAIAEYNELFGKEPNIKFDKLKNVMESIKEKLENNLKTFHEIDNLFTESGCFLTEEEIVHAKRRLILTICDNMPIQAPDCYHCEINKKQDERTSCCAECSFGYQHGICIVDGSHYDEMYDCLDDFEKAVKVLYSFNEKE